MTPGGHGVVTPFGAGAPHTVTPEFVFPAPQAAHVVERGVSANRPLGQDEHVVARALLWYEPGEQGTWFAVRARQ